MEETKNKNTKSAKNHRYPSHRSGKNFDKNSSQKKEQAQKNTSEKQSSPANARKNDRYAKNQRPRTDKQKSKSLKTKDMEEIVLQQNARETRENKKEKSKKKNFLLETAPYKVAKNAPALRVISLGGLGEIGKNITAIECGEDIIVIDCGVAFPDDDMLGVDLVIPEECWEQKRNDIHEYHIDTFVMGDDWEGKFDFLREEGAEVVYLARTPEISTTQIKNELNVSKGQ